MRSAYLPAFALVLLSASVGALGGCASDDGAVTPEDGLDEDLVASSPVGAGIKPGSVEEASVLNLVNDVALDAAALRAKVKLSATVANAVVKFREGATQGIEDDKTFETLAEVDALPLTGKTVFVQLRTYAVANGYDLLKPTMALFEIPDNLGRPPTSSDVRVAKGFDGKTPAKAEAIVRKNLTTMVHPQNERFVSETIQQCHKAFTIGLGNFFAVGSPGARFLEQQTAAGGTLTLLGTASLVNPSVLELDRFGRKAYFVPGPGGYVPLQASAVADTGILRYPVLMRSVLRPTPAGIRLSYPKWSASVLSAPTTTITEGG
jgi:hypothetical protein